MLTITHVLLWAIIAITTATAGKSTAIIKPQRKCSNVSFKLPISYEALVFTSTPDPSNETQNTEFVKSTLGGGPATTSGTHTVSGTFTINGVYCKPDPASRLRHPRRDALQILVHGITYNKDMWSGLGLGEQYNWHAAANAEGYHTLAIDRVGHGPGAKYAFNGQNFPDPLMVMQSSFHVESMAHMIDAIRDNTSKNVLGRKFNKIIYVGHSYGSFLGVALARLHPASINALILTGYSTSINLATAQVYSFRSSSLLNLARFPVTQPLGYVSMSTISSREITFFSGGYDPAVVPVDFALQDTITTGEAGTLVAIASVPASGYTGPVFIATGEDDFIFCQTEGKTCSEILAETLAGFFPDVNGQLSGFFVPKETGHCLTLHYSAGETVGEVSRFLGRFF